MTFTVEGKLGNEMVPVGFVLRACYKAGHVYYLIVTAMSFS